MKGGEAAWHSANASRHAKTPARGRPVDSAVGPHALKGSRRLIDRRKALDDAGKRPVLANMAVARKLVRWCWAVGHMVESTA